MFASVDEIAIDRWWSPAGCRLIGLTAIQESYLRHVVPARSPRQARVLAGLLTGLPLGIESGLAPVELGQAVGAEKYTVWEVLNDLRRGGLMLLGPRCADRGRVRRGWVWTLVAGAVTPLDESGEPGAIVAIHPRLRADGRLDFLAPAARRQAG